MRVSTTADWRLWPSFGLGFFMDFGTLSSGDEGIERGHVELTLILLFVELEFKLYTLKPYNGRHVIDALIEEDAHVS